jgi:hypothetical protein
MVSRLDHGLEILEQGFNNPLTCPTHSHGQIVFHDPCKGATSRKSEQTRGLPFFDFASERSVDDVAVVEAGMPACLSR